MSQPRDLKPLLLFGFAVGDHDQVVYKLRGQMVGSKYHISLELTNHTDEGTYASAFTLTSLFNFYNDELDQSPLNLADTLSWIENAFGPEGTAARGGEAPRWDLAAPGGPRLTAAYQADEDQNPVVLSLPPGSYADESEGFPLHCSLPPEAASEVRRSITDAAVKKTLLTGAKLAECERQRLALAAAAAAVRNLQPDGDKRVDEVIKMLRGLSGTIDSALEAPQAAEEAAAAAAAGAGESESQGGTQRGSPTKRPREEGSEPQSAGAVPVRRAAGAGPRGRRRNQRPEGNPLAIKRRDESQK